MRVISIGVVASAYVAACGASPVAKPHPSPQREAVHTPVPPTTHPGPLDGAQAIVIGYLASPQRALCGALASGAVRCLGPNVGPDLLFDKPVRALMVAGGLCATDRDGGVACTTYDGKLRRLTHLRGTRDLSRLSTNSVETCALVDDGTASCVLADDTPAPLPFGLTAGRAVRALSSECAITMNNELHCRDPKFLAPYANEVGTWTSLVSGMYPRTLHGQPIYQTFAVGLGVDRHVHVVGENFVGELGSGRRGHAGTGVVELDHVDEVAASNTHVCARRGGRVACWGESTGGQVAPAMQLAIPTCQVDTAASLASYKRGLEAERSAFRQCMAAAKQCKPPMTDCMLGCRGPSEESKTVPPEAYIYVQTPEGCLEQSGPTKRTVEPTPVYFPGIEDARQIAVADGITCILRTTGETSCFGAMPGLTLDASGTPR